MSKEPSDDDVILPRGDPLEDQVAQLAAKVMSLQVEIEQVRQENRHLDTMIRTILGYHARQATTSVPVPMNAEQMKNVMQQSAFAAQQWNIPPTAVGKVEEIRSTTVDGLPRRIYKCKDHSYGPGIGCGACWRVDALRKAGAFLNE